ncbi:MAG: primosomal protein N', partial [Burkholderiaceae bacterium]|nr:primosomal protein N' [Burkholderiaceae bacterium]
MRQFILRVAIDAPLDFCPDYRWIAGPEVSAVPEVGQLVLAPFGRRKVTGVIVAVLDKAEVPEEKLREVIAIRDAVPPLSSQWADLCRFAAAYYQRPLGEVMLPGLPKKLRTESTVALERA